MGKISPISKALNGELIESLKARGLRVERKPRSRSFLLTIDGILSVYIVLARYEPTSRYGKPGWIAFSDWRRANPTYLIVPRMNYRNEEVLDYFLLPCLEFPATRVHLHEGTMAALECYRYSSFAELIDRLLEKVPARPG